MTQHSIIIGDVLDGLRSLDAGSCRCCVTSPPYWGLRDYGTASWVGGDAACDHQKTSLVGAASTLRSDGRVHTGPYSGEKAATMSVTPYRTVCGTCGALRVDQQIGLEATPDEYVARIVAVFREVRRVLADDGTLWLNLGDSYNAHPNQRSIDDKAGPKQASNAGSPAAPSRHTPELKPKDLCGIPWLVAFALQADGWWLRQDIIWAKPNPMPESVTDRCTKAHEYIFLLSKSPRYYCDMEAIAEASTTAARPSVARGGFQGKTADMPGREAFRAVTETRNARSVWTIATQPYSEAHFATFPEELPTRCIKAGSAVGDTVLDCFVGSGTTLAMARLLGRNGVGCELNPDYAAMAEDRIGRTVSPASYVSKRGEPSPLFGGGM